MANDSWELATIQHNCKFAAYFIHLYTENYYFFLPHPWQGKNTQSLKQKNQANRKENPNMLSHKLMWKTQQQLIHEALEQWISYRS